MEENNPKNKKLIAVIAAIAALVIILVVVLVFVLSKNGGGASAAIVGKWKHSEIANYTYFLEKDGKGYYGYCEDEATDEQCKEEASEFTYKLNPGKVFNTGPNDSGEERIIDGTIDFTYPNLKNPLTLNYHLDGNELTIYDSYGEPVKYIRQ